MCSRMTRSCNLYGMSLSILNELIIGLVLCSRRNYQDLRIEAYHAERLEAVQSVGYIF